MAEDKQDRDTEDLLDEPSAAKIEEFREKGQVAQSRELASVLSLVFISAAIFVMAPSMAKDLLEYSRSLFSLHDWMKTDLSEPGAVGKLAVKFGSVWLYLFVPVSVLGFIGGALGSFVQIGSIFSMDPLEPKFEKINPIEGIAKYFSMKFVMESVRLLLKFAALLWVSYRLLQTDLLDSNRMLGIDPESMASVWGQRFVVLFSAFIGVFAVFSGIDYFFQRREWMNQVRVTKQEAKDEAKERDGNPQMKARIRSIQRQMSRRRMMDAVKKADVIITNPTHIAIAIQYDKEKMLAPKVIAKGADLIAQKIKEIALNANIPTVENVPLARTLYKTVKIQQTIPRTLYQAVAEVLAYVYRLKNGFQK